MSGDDTPRATPLPRPSPDEWRRLEPLLDAVLDTLPEGRAARIAELGAANPALQAALERMVAECERAYPPLEQTVGNRFPAMFVADSVPMPDCLADRYRIVREVGRGGMAVVYLARDLKHGRDVAVKVVRPELTAALGRSRFLREIEIAAQLRHPHIVPLYDSGEMPISVADGQGASDGAILYYVMPYEAGHSLRERLEREGPLTVDDVIDVLRDVCDALAHAHRHGIVHRDIKPENVLLAGKHALIADFGVARAMSEATKDAPPSNVSMAFGTPTYMAPEQADNDPNADHRVDIYAIGVLAYELLSGRPPVDSVRRRAPNATLAVSAVVPLVQHRADVPDALAGLIMKCLATRPDDRWQRAEDVLAALDSAAIAPAIPAGTNSPHSWMTRASSVIGVTAGLALIVALAVMLPGDRRDAPSLVLGRASQLTSDPGLEVQPSISPDGRQVAYAAGHSLRMHIVVRPVAGGRAMRLTPDSTANEWLPRWSPDGRRILFLSRGGVFSAPASGGSPREEVPSRPGASVMSAAWSADGREIAYVRGDSLLARTTDTVGPTDVRLITTGSDLHSCRWAPDGARIACVSGNSFYMAPGAKAGVGPMFGNLGPSRIVLIPATGGTPVSVTDSGSLHQSPVWSRDARTLYYVSNRQGPRDVYALNLGARAPATDAPIRVTTGIGAHSVDLSSDGVRIVYAAYASTANVWALPIPSASVTSSTSAVPVTSGNQTVEGIRVSPDGRWVVFDSDLSGNSDVYRVPVAGGEAERLTDGDLDEFRGALSPDGRELVYHSFATGSRNMFLAPLDGGPTQQITRPPGQHSMANWSPDGSALTLFDIDRAAVMVMRRDRSGRWGAPRFVGGRGWRPDWSPDGQLVVFVSPTDGRIGIVPADSGSQRDVYVPAPGDPLAELAAFSRSGREIYFKSHDALGRAAFWSIPATGGRPRLLVRFDDPERASNRFEFASDGSRFYFTVEDRQSDIWIAEVTSR